MTGAGDTVIAVLTLEVGQGQGMAFALQFLLTWWLGDLAAVLDGLDAARHATHHAAARGRHTRRAARREAKLAARTARGKLPG